MKILVTGAAGFIGFHTINKLLSKKGITVFGLDNINSYYDTKLKKDRLKILKKRYGKKFYFSKTDITNKNKILKIFKKNKFNTVIHLAAQAGVRYVKKNPDIYFESNLRGFFNILTACQQSKISHLISASTSSVYGANKKLPYETKLPADHPTQFYAASKRSNEIIGHAYSHMYNLPITFLRFFTAYGPWGRPDMSLYIFVESCLKGKRASVYNYGLHSRDFTYIDDIVNGIILTTKKIPKKNKNWNPKLPDPSSSSAPFKILNIGNGRRINLIEYVKTIEKVLNKKMKINLVKFQEGDIKDTLAGIKETHKYLRYKPKTKLINGIKSFIRWYRSYKKI